MKLLKMMWKWTAVITLARVIVCAQTSPDLEQGMKPYGSYHGGNLDHISLTNGNLFFRADLMAYSQRGGELAYPIVLQYNNKVFSIFEGPCSGGGTCTLPTMTVIFGPNPLRTSQSSSGNSVTIGYEGLPGVGAGWIDTSVAFDGNEIYAQPASVVMPDGSTHQLVSTHSGLVAVDGSGYAVPANGFLTSREGTRYSNVGTLAEDRNGNQIILNNGVWADTLGRSLPPLPGPSPTSTPAPSTASLNSCPVLNYSSQPITSAYTWNLPTVNGGTLPLVLCYSSVWVRTSFFTTGSSSGPHSFDVNQSFTMLQSVVFPDTTYWAFQYDAADPNHTSSIGLGDLLKVTFPTGASLSYRWQTWPGCVSQNTPPGGSISRAVQAHTLDAADGRGPHTWNYSYVMGSVSSSPTEQIREHIARKGHHVYVVVGSAIPRYAYTIGVSESIGAELILAGASFYGNDDVVEIINDIAVQLKAERDREKFEVTEYGSFTLRKAHASWATRFMRGALDYYQVSEMPGLQIVPDDTHWTIDVPNLSTTWSATAEPTWRWLHDPCPYPMSKQAMAATNLAALRGGRITEAKRWEEDEWEIFAGDGSDISQDDLRVLALGSLLAMDESLVPVLSLPVGEGLWRDPDPQSEWHPWRDQSEGTWTIQ